MNLPEPTLSSIDLVTSSPIDDPLKTIILCLCIVVLLEFCLRIAKYLNKGVTLSGPKPIPVPLSIKPGRDILPLSDQIKTYKGPGATSLLFVLCYFLVHFMIFVIFKRLDYTFSL